MNRPDFTAKNAPKIAEVKLSSCGLEVADSKKIAIAELRLRKCFLLVAESWACPPLSNTSIFQEPGHNSKKNVKCCCSRSKEQPSGWSRGVEAVSVPLKALLQLPPNQIKTSLKPLDSCVHNFPKTQSPWPRPGFCKLCWNSETFHGSWNPCIWFAKPVIWPYYVTFLQRW